LTAVDKASGNSAAVERCVLASSQSGVTTVNRTRISVVTLHGERATGAGRFVARAGEANGVGRRAITGRVHAARGSNARVISADISVVARDWGVDASVGRNSVLCAIVEIIADNGRVHTATDGVARIRGGKVVVVTNNGRVDAASGRVARVHSTFATRGADSRCVDAACCHVARVYGTVGIVVTCDWRVNAASQRIAAVPCARVLVVARRLHYITESCQWIARVLRARIARRASNNRLVHARTSHASIRRALVVIVAQSRNRGCILLPKAASRRRGAK